MQGTKIDEPPVLDFSQGGYDGINMPAPDLVLIKKLSLVLAMQPNLRVGPSLPAELRRLHEHLRGQPELRLSEQARYQLTVMLMSAIYSLLVQVIDIMLTRVVQAPAAPDPDTHDV